MPLDRERIMIDVFENFIIHYVDNRTKAFALNHAFSDLNILFRNGFSSDEANIIQESINSFVKDYDNFFNMFSRSAVITQHLSEFKQKLGQINKLPLS